MGILEVKDLVTGYNQKRVLDEINLTMEKGEFIGIVGPNGSGKSTFVKAITKVLEPWSGEINLKKKSLSRMNQAEIAKITAVVPQDTYISFPYSVKDVVLMGRNPYKGKLENYGDKDHKIAKKCMEDTRTDDFSQKKITNLSGGEMQRVMVARALAQNPELIFLDEATSHLDIGHKKEIMETIKRKNQKNNLSVISIHHNLNLAARYCEKILLMEDGRRFVFGSPEEVLTEPNLRAVYGIEAEVHEHPTDGSLYIAPLENKEIEKRKDKRIHVICGGGSSKNLFRKLIERGYEVTAGVLNIMDSDYDKAKHFDIKCVTEAPFSSISEDSFNKNLEFIRKADTIIVTDFPIGEANLKNIEAVLEALKFNKEIILINPEEIEDRDYTEENKASDLFSEWIESENSKIVTSIDEVPELV